MIERVTTSLELAKKQFQVGQRAFEGGEYRRSVEAFEQAVGLAGPNTALGGEIQTWLVTAYQAAGELATAIELGERLLQHPDLKTRQQGQRLLYILKAPQLKPRPEWLSQIPDLTTLSDEGKTTHYVSPTPKRLPKKPEPELDLSQVNTKDNRFVWVALAGSLLIAAGLYWLNGG
jgi:tetratricopeptide (TPR) repeat protein